MKQFISLIVVIVCMATMGNAKETGTNGASGLVPNLGLELGLKLGTNFSNAYALKGDGFLTEGKFGLVAGVFAELPISHFLGFHPELLFSQKGIWATSTLNGIDYDFSRTSNYIDVPLLFAVKPIKYFTILAGPQYSRLVKQKDLFMNSNSGVEQQQLFENFDLRKNILGITGGVDFKLKNLVLSARAGVDLQNNNGEGTAVSPRYKYGWYQFSFGYRLFL